MKILLTGGTGFLGRRLVAHLHPRHELTLLVRPTSDRARFPAGVVFAEGDVTDRASLERAAAGVDAIVHAAALVKILAPAAEFDRINVGGLEAVLAAARAADVKQVVYVSSFMALGPTEVGPDGVWDESAPVEDRQWINDYERTKTLSDRAARQAIADGFPLSVVYPGVIYGPGEMTEGNIVVHHILDLLHRRLPALLGRPERRWNYVFVDDVADGIARVLETAPPGTRWVLGGENVTQEAFYRQVAEQTGARIPKLRMPPLLGKLAGAMMKTVARLRRTTPQLTPDLVEVYEHDWALSSAAAQRELGYAPRSLAEGLATTTAWLRETDAWPKS